MEQALVSLCTTSRQFVGILVMLALIFGIVLHASNHILNEKKPDAKRKSLLGKVGNAALILCVLLLVLYYMIPFILPEQCSPKVLPFCGKDYCSNGMEAPLGGNCTCIQY